MELGKWCRFTRVGASGIVVALQLLGPQGQLHHALQGRSMVLILEGPRFSLIFRFPRIFNNDPDERGRV
jgi:hypothetical protein